MNITNNNHELDDTNPIFIYLMIAVEILNMLISLLVAYKLDHLRLDIGHFKCCGLECDNIFMETSDTNDNISRSK